MSTIDIQFDKKIDNSRIQRDFDSSCSREYLSLTLLGAVFVVCALFYGWQQYQWIQYGYRIEEKQKQIEELVEVGRQLTVERGMLASPQRIDAIARSLGMITPNPDGIVMLDAEYAIPVDSADSRAIETQLAQRTDD